MKRAYRIYSSLWVPLQRVKTKNICDTELMFYNSKTLVLNTFFDIICYMPDDKTKKKQSTFTEEVRERTAGYIMAGFGFVAGLAWNDAIKSFIEHIFPLSSGAIAAKFVYAVLITVVIVIVGNYLLRADKK